jgi:uncharacterized protein YbjT (DUF2867 family)
MRVAVAGSSGEVGRRVVHELAVNGHDVVPLARSAGVDVLRATDLARHLAGVDALIDCLGIVTTRTRTAVAFFTESTRRLLEAERAAGVGHHVLLSIVGIDEVPLGYYRAKVEQERAAKAAGHPLTIVRATQFHEFARQMLNRGRHGPVVLAPKMVSAPIAAAEVAQALAELAVAPPAGETLELGGPQTLQMADLIARVAGADAVRARVIPIRLPGAAGRGLMSGALVPNSPWRTGVQTFDQWLQVQA